MTASHKVQELHNCHETGRQQKQNKEGFDCQCTGYASEQVPFKSEHKQRDLKQ